VWWGSLACVWECVRCGWCFDTGGCRRVRVGAKRSGWDRVPEERVGRVGGSRWVGVPVEYGSGGCGVLVWGVGVGGVGAVGLGIGGVGRLDAEDTSKNRPAYRSVMRQGGTCGEKNYSNMSLRRFISGHSSKLPRVSRIQLEGWALTILVRRARAALGHHPGVESLEYHSRVLGRNDLANDENPVSTWTSFQAA